MLGYCLYAISLPLNNLADNQQVALSLLQTQTVTVNQVMSFLGKTIFVPVASLNCGDFVISFRVAC